MSNVLESCRCLPAEELFTQASPVDESQGVVVLDDCTQWCGVFIEFQQGIKPAGARSVSYTHLTLPTKA